MNSVQHSVQLTTLQCKFIQEIVHKRRTKLESSVNSINTSESTDNYLLDLKTEYNSLEDVDHQLSAIISRYRLFDYALDIIDTRNREVNSNTLSEEANTQCYTKQYMKCDDCAIYRQYIHTKFGIEPATIFVIMLRNDGGLTIVINDNMQKIDVNTQEELVSVLKQFKLC